MESEVGRGSAFVVDLELRVARHRDSREFFERMGIDRVLVVDDERAVCDEVVAVMGDAGVGAEFALTGAVSMAAEAEAEGRGFGLVIVDWRMPAMDGAQTARAIRDVVPHNVPVMVLTAFDRADAESACDGAGVDGFLQKPFFLSSLTLLLEELSGHGGEGASSGVEQAAGGPEDVAAEEHQHEYGQ